MKGVRIILLLTTLAASACARFQPSGPAISPSDYTISGMEQSATMKDTSIHYDPAILKVGTPQSAVQAAFGDPNGTRTTDSGQPEDVYAFYPDGTKFVNPQVRPRNIALAVFTMGTSVAVRQARLHMAEKKLTLYHILYAPDDTIASVREEKMSDAPVGGPSQTPN